MAAGNTVQAITVRDWWQKAEASGQRYFHDLGEIWADVQRSELGEHFTSLGDWLGISMSTLADWWELVGQFLYYPRGKAGFAEDLSELMPPDWSLEERRIPRKTVVGWINKGRMPKYEEYLDALYAVTALPAFDRGVARSVRTERIPLVPGLLGADIEAVKQAALVEGFGEALLQAVRQALSLASDEKDRAAVLALVGQIQSALDGVVEDERLSDELAHLFDEIS